MQALLTNMALVLTRLEEEEEASVRSGGAAELARERARKATLKIVSKASRCSWCILICFCGLASFIGSGADVRKAQITRLD